MYVKVFFFGGGGEGGGVGEEEGIRSLFVYLFCRDYRNSET